MVLLLKSGEDNGCSPSSRVDRPSPTGHVQPEPSPTGHVQPGPSPTVHVQPGPSPTGHEQPGPSPTGHVQPGHLRQGMNNPVFEIMYTHIFMHSSPFYVTSYSL